MICDLVKYSDIIYFFFFSSQDKTSCDRVVFVFNISLIANDADFPTVHMRHHVWHSFSHQDKQTNNSPPSISNEVHGATENTSKRRLGKPVNTSI